jgi:mannose-6-phosphate isomerase-like protein (cupin superfamily)
MSFYNFKLNDPSTFSTSASPDTKSPGRFVHKTFQDYQSKTSSAAAAVPVPGTSTGIGSGGLKIAPKTGTSTTVLTNDGRGKFSVPGWKEKGVIAPGGEKSRFRLNKPSENLNSSLNISGSISGEGQVDDGGGGGGGGILAARTVGVDFMNPVTGEYTEFNETHDPEQEQDIQPISITNSLQTITRTYTPVQIATLNSLSPPTTIRLVKLAGQSSWHTYPHTDEIFILLRGAIEILYRPRGGTGEEKVARCLGGELLRVPRGWEHCVIAEEGTEVILLEGSDERVVGVLL